MRTQPWRGAPRRLDRPPGAAPASHADAGPAWRAAAEALDVVGAFGPELMVCGHVRGTVTVGGRKLAVDAAGLVDEFAGYHARHTPWRWSAGVGLAESGAPVAWNFAEGLHDAAAASEQTVWVGGEPREVGPVRFGGRGGGNTPADLAGVAFAEGGELRFVAEATRTRRESLLLMRSDYVQPFGTFAGELPGAGRLREGWGVRERHDVRW